MIEENFRIIGIKVRIGEVFGASTRQMRLFMGEEELLVDLKKLADYLFNKTSLAIKKDIRL